MSYKVFASIDIAVIGTGSVSEMYAAAFAGAGHHVYIAHRDGDDSALIDPLLEVYDNVHFCSIEEAAEVADLIIIATSPRDVREVAYWLGDVRRKVIIDATANVYAAEEELVKTLFAIRAITGSPHVVKAFCTQGYEHLIKPLFNGEKVELILAGDSRKAKEIARIMAVEMGITHSYDFGDDSTILLFNELTRTLRSLATSSIGSTLVKAI